MEEYRNQEAWTQGKQGCLVWEVFTKFFEQYLNLKPLSEDRNIYLCMKIKQSMNPGESAMFDVKTPMSYYVQCVMT